MACFLFTWHAYGSWLPDREQGYVHWSRGESASSIALAQHYRNQQTATKVEFSGLIQQEIVSEILEAVRKIEIRLHYATADRSHVLALVSWQDQRSWEKPRRSLRQSITERLTSKQRRNWLSRGGHVRRVQDIEHFTYLTKKYLPSHKGWKWNEQRGLFQ